MDKDPHFGWWSTDGAVQEWALRAKILRQNAAALSEAYTTILGLVGHPHRMGEVEVSPASVTIRPVQQIGEVLTALGDYCRTCGLADKSVIFAVIVCIDVQPLPTNASYGAWATDGGHQKFNELVSRLAVEICN